MKRTNAKATADALVLHLQKRGTRSRVVLYCMPCNRAFSLKLPAYPLCKKCGDIANVHEVLP